MAEARKRQACRPFDTACPEGNQNVAADGRELAINTYGYTSIFEVKRPRADPSIFTDLESSLPANMAILFVNRFQGGRRARLLEIWMVDHTKLDEVLAIPVPEIDRTKSALSQNIRARNAEPFEALLKQSMRLSQEWSPLFALQGKLYFVERECSGTWVYGAYYACNRVIKLTIKQIDPDRGAVPYCEWSRPPSKPKP